MAAALPGAVTVKFQNAGETVIVPAGWVHAVRERILGCSQGERWDVHVSRAGAQRRARKTPCSASHSKP